MDALYFLIRYTPFWGVPVGMIAVQFAYIYWLKDIRRISYLLVIVALFCLVCVILYLVAGGPDDSVKRFQELVSSF